MSPLHRPLINTLIFLSTAATGVGHAAATAAPLSVDATEALLACPISLASAKENLGSLGYTITASAANSFSTGYKTSDRDSEKKLLGGYSVQRERQYQVSATGSSSIRFSARYRETEFESEGRGNTSRDKVREYAAPLTQAMADTLKDMQAEICSPGERKAAKEHIEKKSLQLDQYLRDRCKAGDDAACQLLSAK